MSFLFSDSAFWSVVYWLNMQALHSLDVSFFPQHFLCSLIPLAIPSLCSTPGVNIFTPLCVCVYTSVPLLWFVLNLKPEVTINGSDYFLAVNYWLSLSLVSELLSQGDASRVEIGGGDEEKLDRSLAVYLKATWGTECTHKEGGKLPGTYNLGWKIREAKMNQWCQLAQPGGLFMCWFLLSTCLELPDYLTHNAGWATEPLIIPGEIPKASMYEPFRSWGEAFHLSICWINFLQSPTPKHSTHKLILS